MCSLNELIKKSNYKIEFFLYELNVSRSTFWKMRKGLRPVRENEADKLSKLLGMTKKEIMEVLSCGRNS